MGLRIPVGIKNIHIVLITASAAVSVFFGTWAIKNNYAVMGYVSLITAVGLVAYGVSFWKKAGKL